MPDPTDSPAAPATALERALAAILRPLARLAVARGMSFAAVEVLFKRAFIDAARAAHPGMASHRMVSRISTVTGLNRREVTKLTLAPPDTPLPQRSLVSEVFSRWHTDAAWRTPQGRPLELPRQGPAPSFEALAQSITRDVHPRSLLDEMVRLGLAAFDDRRNVVNLLQDAFVPHGDQAQMMTFMGHNVGDHLLAAVDNVLGDGTRHFEQAIFADELSQESIEQARGLISEKWRELLDSVVPQLEGLIAADIAHGRPQDQRLRIGLYAYTAAMRDQASVPIPATKKTREENP